MVKRIVLFYLCLSLLSSCVNTRKATYFNNLPDTRAYEELKVPQHLLEPNDVLAITVGSQNLEAARIFNTPGQSDARSTSSEGKQVELAGYLVNQQGQIHLMILGDVRAAGLTTDQLRTFIRTDIVQRKLLVDPVVEVRLLNFKVTVLGEVARPAVVTVPNEKITLFEALGLAGDITLYGRRDNVLVIRETNGKRVATRVNLNSDTFFGSPHYYLQPNDVVYVEPNKSRVSSAGRINQYLPAIVSSFSVIIILVDRLFLR